MHVLYVLSWMSAQEKIAEIVKYIRARNQGAAFIEKLGGMLIGLTWFGNINSQGSPGF
jgi:hypothetical protein